MNILRLSGATIGLSLALLSGAQGAFTTQKDNQAEASINDILNQLPGAPYAQGVIDFESQNAVVQTVDIILASNSFVEFEFQVLIGWPDFSGFAFLQHGWIDQDAT